MKAKRYKIKGYNILIIPHFQYFEINLFKIWKIRKLFGVLYQKVSNPNFTYKGFSLLIFNKQISCYK